MFVYFRFDIDLNKVNWVTPSVECDYIIERLDHIRNLLQ